MSCSSSISPQALSSIATDGRRSEASRIGSSNTTPRSVVSASRSPQGALYPLPGIVHRLDRSTTGDDVVAKTPAMYAYLKQAFKERRVEKTYRAYVHGHMEKDEGRIIAEIKRSAVAPRTWYAEACDEEHKRAAITDWRVLSRLPEANRNVEVRPRTGRTHQIRVHCALIGYPLVGDEMYEGKAAMGFTAAGAVCVSYFARLPSGIARFEAVPDATYPITW